MPGVGSARSLRQRAAEIITEDPFLDVVARVVAWLETLAGQGLDNEERFSGRCDRTQSRTVVLSYNTCLPDLSHSVHHF